MYRTENKVLRRQLRALQDELAQAQENRALVEDKYSSMVLTCGDMWLHRELLEQELEDLSKALFEEANKMVSTEARLRAELQDNNQILNAKLVRPLLLILNSVLIIISILPLRKNSCRDCKQTCPTTSKSSRPQAGLPLEIV